MSKEGIHKENKEWIIASTKDRSPESLSEIAILTDHDEFTLDQIVGKDFLVEINAWEDPMWDNAFKEIVLSSIDDIIALFHEIGHAVIDTEKGDRVVENILRKIEGKIRTGEDIHDLNRGEVEELILIRAERMASAYALRKIRQINNERGINFLQGKSFKKDVKTRIHRAINSHFRKIRDTREYREKFLKLLERLGINEKKK